MLLYASFAIPYLVRFYFEYYKRSLHATCVCMHATLTTICTLNVMHWGGVSKSWNWLTECKSIYNIL